MAVAGVPKLKAAFGSMAAEFCGGGILLT